MIIGSSSTHTLCELRSLSHSRASRTVRKIITLQEREYREIDVNSWRSYSHLRSRIWFGTRNVLPGIRFELWRGPTFGRFQIKKLKLWKYLKCIKNVEFQLRTLIERYNRGEHQFERERSVNCKAGFIRLPCREDRLPHSLFGPIPFNFIERDALSIEAVRKISSGRLEKNHSRIRANFLHGKAI